MDETMQGKAASDASNKLSTRELEISVWLAHGLSTRL